MKAKLLLLLVALSLGACSQAPSPGPSSSNTSSSSTSSPTSSTGDVAIKDPDHVYDYFSDPSITQPPEKDALFGTGQTLSLTYDGSKTKEGDSLFYQLYYVSQNGTVLQASGAPFEGKTKGVFSTNNTVYTSDAHGRPGFIEVTAVQDVKMEGGDKGITGKQLKLGMYPIRFAVPAQ